MKIKLSQISKNYPISKKETFHALKNINLSFEQTGLYALFGKSGCGKSTLINLIARIDKPSSGALYINKVNICEKKNKNYCKNRIGILFQSYNLIEEHSVIDNLVIPLLINGYSKKVAISKAKEMLLDIGIKEELFNNDASLLSGGEKQRLSFLRAISNNPEVLLCDEPTGALDDFNAKILMEKIKKYSENHLVIFASHNLQLVIDYSDNIIEMDQGKITHFSSYREHKNEVDKVIFRKKNPLFIFLLIKNNFKRRFRRNFFSFFSLLISFSFLFLTCSFIYGKDNSINLAATRQFDYGVGTISKEEKISSGGLLSITKSVRPDIGILGGNGDITSYFHISANFDAIFTANSTLFYEEDELKSLQMSPVYDFKEEHVRSDLLYRGRLPTNELEEVVVNQNTLFFLSSRFGKDMLGETLTLTNDVTSTYFDADGTIIEDFLSINLTFKIVGVVNEFGYMLNEKIYYSHQAILEYLNLQIMENLSTYFDNSISWIDRVKSCPNSYYLSSYSYYLFLKDIDNWDVLERPIYGGLTYTNNSLLKKSTITNFVEIAEYGLVFFLIVTALGAILILGVISFTNYSEDHKKSAILTTLGASNNDILFVYLFENVLLSLLAFAFSILLTFLLSLLINPIIFKYLYLNNVLVLPLLKGLGVIFGLLIVILVALVITVIPISFSKRISIKEEIQSL